MVVEADVNMQNVLRVQLKRRGYRVLVTSDPSRALDRFSADPQVAHVVLFSTGALGKPALSAFNQSSQIPGMRDTPAVLLLDERHKDWQAQARTGPQRIVLTMPIKLRELRESLLKLCGSRVT
jgi:serine/threonine-protein kinase